MAFSNSSYGNGRGSIQASPWAANTGLVDVRSLLKPKVEEPVPVAQTPQVVQQTRGILGSSPTSGLEAEQLKALRLANQDAQMRLDAKSRPAPQVWHSGFNMGSFLTPDENAMNAYQREAFLPQGSQMQAGPARSGASLSPDMPDAPEQEDSGERFRRGALADALKQSNATAGQQLKGFQPNSIYGR